jgi:hypothetical protein
MVLVPRSALRTIQWQCNHGVDEFALQNHKSKDLRKRLDGIGQQELLIVKREEHNWIGLRQSDKVKLARVVI